MEQQPEPIEAFEGTMRYLTDGVVTEQDLRIDGPHGQVVLTGIQREGGELHYGVVSRPTSVATLSAHLDWVEEHTASFAEQADRHLAGRE